MSCVVYSRKKYTAVAVNGRFAGNPMSLYPETDDYGHSPAPLMHRVRNPDHGRPLFNLKVIAAL